MQFCFSVKIIYLLSHYYIDVYELQLLRQIFRNSDKKSNAVYTIFERYIGSPCSCDHVRSLNIFGAIILFESVVAINTYGTCPFYYKYEKYLELLCFSQEISSALVLFSLGKI